MKSRFWIPFFACALLWTAGCAKKTVVTPEGAVTEEDGKVTVKTKEGTAEWKGDDQGATATFEGADGKTTTVTVGGDSQLPAGWPEGMTPAKGKMASAVASNDGASCIWDMDKADVAGELEALSKKLKEGGFAEQGRMTMSDMTTVSFHKDGAGTMAILCSTAGEKGTMTLTWSTQ